MRLFLAAELPDELLGQIEQVRAGLASTLVGWRWVRAASVHLTLRFLGEVEPRADLEARDGWRRVAAAARPFRLRPSGLGRFPPRGRPRVLWLGIEETSPGDALSALSAELERTARGQGWSAERRPFRPHLTLARAERGTRPDEPPEVAAVGGSEVLVRELVLYRSLLGAGGARYTALESFPLGRPAQPHD